MQAGSLTRACALPAGKTLVVAELAVEQVVDRRRDLMEDRCMLRNAPAVADRNLRELERAEPRCRREQLGHIGRLLTAGCFAHCDMLRRRARQAVCPQW